MATTRIVALGEGDERLVAADEHPGHRDDHRHAGDQHRAPGRRGGGLQRGALAAPGGALLALASQIEQRVVDPTASPISRTTAGRLESTGSSWLAIATSPSAASTAVIPISSGRPAATSVPKVMMRMISVTGSESSPPSRGRR